MTVELDRETVLIPHVDYDIDYGTDRMHLNDISAYFETFLDESINKLVRNKLDVDDLYVESSFDFKMRDDGTVDVIFPHFHIDKFYGSGINVKNYINDIENILFEFFGFEDCDRKFFTVDEEAGNVVIIIYEIKRMVKFLENLEKLNIPTNGTFEIKQNVP